MDAKEEEGAGGESESVIGPCAGWRVEAGIAAEDGRRLGEQGKEESA